MNQSKPGEDCIKLYSNLYLNEHLKLHSISHNNHSLDGKSLMIKVRQQTPADSNEIEALTIAAFKDALHSSYTEHLILNQLRNAGALTLSIIAEQNKHIVGHVAISPVSLSDGAKDWYGLGPVSVSPQHQNKGIGSRLIRQALDELKAIGAVGCVVLGDPAYYARFGFKADPALILADVPPEYFQTLHLRKNSAQGEVRYHEAFKA